MQRIGLQSRQGALGITLVLLLATTLLAPVPLLTSNVIIITGTENGSEELNQLNVDNSQPPTIFNLAAVGRETWSKSDLLSERGVTQDLYVLPSSPSPPDLILSGTPHAPIYIDENSDFEIQGWPGEGSVEQPYVITGLEINATTGVAAINITNTDVHFVIKDCRLSSNSLSVIELRTVAHAQIINNTIMEGTRGVSAYHSSDLSVLANEFYTFSWAGVYLENSSESIVSNNNCTSCFIGLHVEQLNNVQIKGNHVTLCETGISLYLGCEYVTVFNNTLWNCEEAISLYIDCDNNIIQSNNFTMTTMYGIIIADCDSNHIIDNFGRQNYADLFIANSTFHVISNNDFGQDVGSSYGAIALYHSNNSIVTNNHIEDSYICIEINGWSSYNTISNNNCTLFAGGVVIWYEAPHNTVINNTCNGEHASEVGIYILESEHCELYKNRCNQSLYNIVVESSNHTDISENTCFEAIDQSLAIFSSYFVNVEGNTFSFSSSGINAEDTEGVITHNTIENNTLYGLVVIGSTELNVTWNIFENNGLNAEDNGLHTYIDYNYWSNYTGYDANADGIGDVWHPIDGTEHNNDTHPLMFYPTIPSWTIEPTDQCSEYGEEFLYTLFITIPPKAASISEWWISDSHFVIDSGVIRNESSLSLGEYQLEVRAYNLYGFYLSGTLTVTVDDTIAPLITGSEDFSYSSDSTGYFVHWYAIDAGPVSYSVALDGIIIRSGAWNVSNEEVFILCDGLEIGVHNYTVTFTDIGGNLASDTVIVTVTLSPSQIFGPILGLAIGGTAIVVVIAALYLVRKKATSK